MARNSRMANMVALIVAAVAIIFNTVSCFALTPTPTQTATATPTADINRYPSDPFVAMTDQGRPLTGASIAVTDAGGGSVAPCINAACSSWLTAVPSTGIVQFYQVPGTYTVLVSGSGITRNYKTLIPASAAGLVDGDFANPGLMRKVSNGVYTTIKVMLTATTDPGVNNDGSEGYSPGSFWINTLSDTIFFCTDSSIGAADWVSNGAGGVTSINSQAGPAVTITNGSSGTDFNIASSGNVVTINLPSASTTKRGLITTGTQSFAGAKSFEGAVSISNDFQVQNSANTVIFMPFASTDNLGFFSSATTGWVNVEGLSGSKPALYVAHDDTGDAIQATVAGSGSTVAIRGTVGGTNVGAGIGGFSTSANGQAGIFQRSVSSSTVPVVSIQRNNSSDSTTLLNLDDLASSSAATYALTYMVNGSTKLGLQTNGQIAASDGTGSSTPGFTFIGDTDSGLDEVGGAVCLVDEALTPLCTLSSGTGVAMTGNVTITTSSAVPLAIVNASAANDFTINSTEFIINSGELTFTGVSGDGTGKALCVKADGFIGTCTNAVGGGGTCTCA